MKNFIYHTPSDAHAAVAALETSEDGHYIAGGMTLLPTMKQGLAEPDVLVDLSHTNLSGIGVSGNDVTIGAMTTHAEVAASAEIAKVIPALSQLASNIGDRQVRSRGTIGGSVANNDPSADYPAACLGLGATLVTNRREIAADDFFVGLFETALDEGELITAVKFPKPKKAAYMKFNNPASRYALVGVMVAQTSSGTRVAITGAGEDGVFRSTKLETALGADLSGSIDDVTISADGLMTDLHATAIYRAQLIKVMTGRAVAKTI